MTDDIVLTIGKLFQILINMQCKYMQVYANHPHGISQLLQSYEVIYTGKRLIIKSIIDGGGIIDPYINMSLTTQIQNMTVSTKDGATHYSAYNGKLSVELLVHILEEIIVKNSDAYSVKVYATQNGREAQCVPSYNVGYSTEEKIVITSDYEGEIRIMEEDE